LYSPESIYFAGRGTWKPGYSPLSPGIGHNATTPGEELYGLRFKAQGSRGIFLRSGRWKLPQKREAAWKTVSFPTIPAAFFASRR